MDINQLLTGLLLLALVIFIIYQLVMYFRRKNAGEDISQEEFKRNMRRGQIIDVREPVDYNNGHILGARNIPYTQLKIRKGEIRRDQPIFLYENGESLARRASLILRQDGYKDIYRLRGGYEEWDGRIKSER